MIKPDELKEPLSIRKVISKFLWFLFPRILGYFRRIRLKHYKHQKVIAMKKILDERDYKIFFYVTINDNKNPQKVGPYDMIVPGRGIYFAKRRLLNHIVSNVDVEIIDFNRHSDTKPNQIVS